MKLEPMYLSFYKLQRKPFSIAADPKFLWLGEKHREALSAMKFGILENKGFLVLTGDVGTGKTTLVNYVLSSLEKRTLAASIIDPGVGPLELWNFISDGFSLKRTFSTKREAIGFFRRFLLHAADRNTQVLLIVDEAQKISDENLEELRTLSNLERPDTKLINIFFVGQPEFLDNLSKPRNRALSQRICVHYHIPVFTEAETDQYIRHRLHIGGTDSEIFSPSAVQEIYCASEGVPRLINVICDHAMLLGFVTESPTIESDLIREVVSSLMIPKRIGSHPTSEIPQNRVTVLPDEKEKRNVKPFQWAVAAVLLLCLGWLGWRAIGDSFGVAVKSRTEAWTNSSIATEPKPLPASRADVEGPSFPTAAEARETSAVPPPVTPKTEVQTSTASEKEASSSVRDAAPVAPLPMETISEAARMDLHFGYDSSELPPDSLSKLEFLAEMMKKDETLTLEIRGYTDTAGNPIYNRQLSEIRAKRISDFFIDQGIDPIRVHAIGMGAIETGDDPSANRRAEIRLERVPPESSQDILGQMIPGPE